MDRLNFREATGASLTRSGGADDELLLKGRYTIECVTPTGETRWAEVIDNTVTTVGKNDLLDKYLSGSSYSAAFYIGLVDGATTPTYAAANTMASHTGWTESTIYSNASRPSVTFASASSGSKGSSTTSDFNINGTGTIAGSFLATDSTKGGTAGVLFSVGSFSSGNRSVISGDVLKVTYSLAV